MSKLSCLSLVMVSLMLAGCSTRENFTLATSKAKNRKPTAAGQALPPSGSAPLATTIDASGSSDSDGTIVLYEIKTGSPGDPHWHEAPSGTWPVIYQQPGAYTAHVRVTDDDGAKDSMTFIVTVSTVNIPPAAQLSADLDSGVAPLDVSFDASDSNDPDGSIVKFEWDFDGDGGWDLDSGADPTTEHTYVEPGSFAPAVRATDNGGASAVAALSVEVSAAPPPSPGPWPMFGLSPQHQGRCPYSGPDSANLLWRHYCQGNVYSSPAIAENGTVYVSSYGQKIIAVNPDGTRKWTYELALEGSFCSPAILPGGNVVVAGGADQTLYCFDPTGGVVWTFNTGGYMSSSPAVTTDRIYIGSGGPANSLLALDFDGNLLWSYVTGADVETSPAVGADGTVYFGSIDQYIYAVNPDGSLLWRRNTPGSPVLATPMVGDDGCIYAASLFYLYALEPDGSLRWAQPGTLRFTGRPAMDANGNVLMGDLSGTLYVWDGVSGTPGWSYFAGGGIKSGPAIGADGTVYFGSRDDMLRALDSNGTLLWQYAAGGNLDSSPAIGSDGRLYVGSDDGYLYCFGDA